MKSKLEIIKETREHYERHPGRRSFDEEETCLYVGSAPDQFCAVGRCMKQSARNKVVKMGWNVSVFYEMVKHFEDKYDKIFKSKYVIEDKEFWADLQRFHDDNLNWDLKSGALSEGGLEEYKELIEKYS